MKSYTLSPSSIGLYSECGRCYWKQMKRKERRPRGFSPSLPMGVDKVMKEYFDSFQEKEELPPVLAALGDVSLYHDREQLRTWQNNFSGIEMMVGRHRVHGAVDYVLEKESKLIVLDVKTRGFTLKQESVDRHYDQLSLYNLLLRKNGFETEDYSLVLYLHPELVVGSAQTERKNELITNSHTISSLDIRLDASLITIPTSVDHAEKLVHDALDVLKGRRMPAKGRDCGYC